MTDTPNPHVDDRGYLTIAEGTDLPLLPTDDLLESVHVFSEEEVCALNAALATRRALLVRGEPGTGKTQLARAAAVALRRPLIHQTVDSHTEPHELLWRLDAVARLGEAQVMATRKGLDNKTIDARLALSRFIRPGALWWALDPIAACEQQATFRERLQDDREACALDTSPYDPGTVVLIDEIDKADSSVPNGLLDALGQGGFNLPDGRRIRMDTERPRPLILITTNEERELPDAFLRRCLVLTLSLPEEDADLLKSLKKRGSVHFKAMDPSVVEEAATLVLADRGEAKKRGLYKPGLAEYLDLLRAVDEQASTAEAQSELLASIARFTLRKYPAEPR